MLASLASDAMGLTSGNRFCMAPKLGAVAIAAEASPAVLNCVSYEKFASQARKKISLGVGPAKPTSEPLEKLGSGLTTVEMPGGGNSKVWVDPAIDET